LIKPDAVSGEREERSEAESRSRERKTGTGERETGTGVHVGIRCDAGPVTGVGHLIRGIALAEEFAARGAKVTFLSNVGNVPWARRQLTDRGLPLAPGPVTPEGILAAVAEHDLDLVVVDSYTLDPACGTALRHAGVPVVSIVDGDTRDQIADLYVDQNLDAELNPVPLPPGARRLAGLPYALLRDSVRASRPAVPRGPDGVGPPRVLCFFGGTDAYGAAPTLAELLAETGEPFAATVVAGRPELAPALAGVRAGPGQSIAVIEPSDSLPALIAGADVVVSASGTSTWELLCLGAAAAMVWVVDNQQLGFDRVVARGLAVGLGRLDDLAAGGAATEFAVCKLRDLLVQPGWRGELSARAWSAVDGRGRERVADAALSLIQDKKIDKTVTT
jgi:spore coat polysaccharide biosynthesis predicted glycosyltransferase SpsG